MNNLTAPFAYFGGKRKAARSVWQAFGDVKNYVEPFAGSAAMLLAAPEGARTETINDFDGFVANFWRAVAQDPEAVAHHADWPCSEADLHARHAWLVNQRQNLTTRLMGCPAWHDPKIAGWWVWGMCSTIGDNWCSGAGPWMPIDGVLMDVRPHGRSTGGLGIGRSLPHLGPGRGINRQLARRAMWHTGMARREFIVGWFCALRERLRDVRVACGDWRRVLGYSVTCKHGMTAVFLDPPYAHGDMNYGAGGMGLGIADAVRDWCAESGRHDQLRIVLCGHAGEHDALLARGWHTRKWKAGSGYAGGDDAKYKMETLWCSPACVPEVGVVQDLFAAECAA